MSKRFVVTVDGKRMSMIFPEPVTLEHARQSAAGRFGAQRLESIDPA